MRVRPYLIDRRLAELEALDKLQEKRKCAQLELGRLTAQVEHAKLGIRNLNKAIKDNPR